MAKKKATPATPDPSMVPYIAEGLRPLAVSIDELTLDPANARKHPEANLEAIKASLKVYGQRKPIVVNKRNGVIEAGNGTLEAARELGWSHLAALFVDDDPTTATGFAIADNRTAELAIWDNEALSKLLAQDLTDDPDLAKMFDELRGTIPSTPTPIEADPDDVPAPPDAATTKPGQIWILGDHRLLCGDSSSAEDVDRLVAGNPIHLVNTDPPYNVKVEPRSNNAIAAGLSSFPQGSSPHYHGFDVARDAQKGKKTHKKLRPKDRPLINDFVSDAAFDEMLLAWFGNMARVLEPGRAFYIWGGYANVANYPPALAASELYFSQSIIWVKEHPVLTRKDFMGNHEWCFYGWREGAAHQWLGPMNVFDVWHIQKGGKGVLVATPGGSKPGPTWWKWLGLQKAQDWASKWFGPETATDVWSIKKINPQAMIHLTEKPVELATRAMEYSSRPGENVLDLFGGSGSTLIGAEKTGRKAFLMELDPLYCDVIVQRWETYSGKKATLEPSKT